MNGEGKLHRRYALIAGAASSMGEAVTRMLAQEGAQIVAVDSPESGIQTMYSRLPQVRSEAIDVVSDEGPDAIMSVVEEALEGLDIVVWVSPEAPPTDNGAYDPQQWDRLQQSVTRPAYRLAHAALALLRQSPGGRILNVGAVHAQFGAGGAAAYTAAQHGLIGLTRSMAQEVGRDGIGVNCIVPGAVMTEATRDAFRRDTGLRDQWIRRSAFGRLGEPIDIAKVALFLCSEDAAFVTGAAIPVDGGALRAI